MRFYLLFWFTFSRAFHVLFPRRFFLGFFMFVFYPPGFLCFRSDYPWVSNMLICLCFLTKLRPSLVWSDFFVPLAFLAFGGSQVTMTWAAWTRLRLAA